jgi:hypothetical protein
VGTFLDRRSLLVGGVAGVVLLALVVAAWVRLDRVRRREECLWNLSRIGMTLQSTLPHRLSGWDGVGTGRQFFLDAPNWPGPPPVPIGPELFVCPVLGKPGKPRVDYRGPAKMLKQLEPGDPVVADRPGNHGSGEGGNVVLRNGSWIVAGELDAAWVRAGQTTTDASR